MGRGGGVKPFVNNQPLIISLQTFNSQVMKLKPSPCASKVVVLKLCKWRLIRVLLFYMWCQCMVVWFFSTFFYFSYLFASLPWNFGMCGEVGTRDHCQIGLLYYGMLALKIILLTTFLYWNVHNKTCVFVGHFEILHLWYEQLA